MMGWLAGAFGVLLGTFVAVGAVGLAGPKEALPVPSAADALLLSRPGPALRAALAYAASGQDARAETLLVALAERHPVIADYADLERLRLYAASGRAEEALALGEAWAHEDSPLGADVHREVGRTRAAQGDETAARAAFERALAATGDAERRAELLVELGHSLLRSGLDEAAAERFIEVWVKYPLAEVSGLDATLEALERELARKLRTPERYRERGDVLFRERRNEAALAAYEQALALGLGDADARRARRQRAHTLFRMRRYTEAADAFASLPRNADNRIAQQRARARAGDVPGAAEELERIAREVRGGQGAYAKLVAALLWDGENETQRAHGLFVSLAKSGGRYSADALWRLGWEAYRRGDSAEALEDLGKLAERERDPIARLRARYWRARASEQAGRSDAAEQFAAMAREFPLSYYGWRAAQRANAGARAEAPPATEISRGSAVLAPRELERPRILLEAGLVDEAREELDRLFVRASGLDDRLQLAELYADAGDFNRPQRLMVGAYQETLARGPALDSIELWWHAWPVPYPDSVGAATEDRKPLGPELVYAIMREESGYRPAVRSVSGALGLLQLMPETAERVARRESLEGFRVDDLFLPQVNIRLGAAYLDELLGRFGGRASAAIGSYNAGPHRVERWLAEGPIEDDEWVEAIPYEQTRSYVKRVLRSVHAYRVLY